MDPADAVLNLVDTHPKVLVGGALVENPYYLPPERWVSTSASPEPGTGRTVW
ncbi:hypothetical protein [Pseudonocardia sp. H11422]|uniref:hypothetical protein n=1 Tax=Pseudonocardia sp. H11422 TaxID=2835866 RepID=UPI001BDD2870|nr:hypothetical protein [Pseudonocardia sp. H11422]